MLLSTDQRELPALVQGAIGPKTANQQRQSTVRFNNFGVALLLRQTGHLPRSRNVEAISKPLQA
jgi:hypothetical protein